MVKANDWMIGLKRELPFHIMFIHMFKQAVGKHINSLQFFLALMSDTPPHHYVAHSLQT